LRHLVWSLAFLALLLSAPVLRASTISDPADVCLRALRNALSEELNAGGEMNTITMARVMSHFDVEVIDHLAQGRLADRFELLGSSGPTDTARGQVVAISSHQITKKWSFKRERLVIWLQRGVLTSSRETEDVVREMFAAQGKALPMKGEWMQPNISFTPFIWTRNGVLMILLVLCALFWGIFKMTEKINRKREQVRFAQ
jgi:hypothetical protein